MLVVVLGTYCCRGCVYEEASHLTVKYKKYTPFVFNLIILDLSYIYLILDYVY